MKGLLSDMEGLYQIDVTEELEKADSVKLVFQYPGYGYEVRAIRRADFASSSEIQVDVNFIEDVQMVSFDLVMKKPSLWKRLTNWLRKK